MAEIEISVHARERMVLRGVEEHEVVEAIREGRPEPARRGRTMYRREFAFESWWRGRYYVRKVVSPVVAEEGERLVVVTVYAFYAKE